MSRQKSEDIYVNLCEESGRKPIQKFLEQLQQRKTEIFVQDIVKQDFKSIGFTLPKIPQLTKVLFQKVQFAPENLIYFLTNSKFLKCFICVDMDFVFAPQQMEDIFSGLPIQTMQQLTLQQCKLGENFIKAISPVIRDSKINYLNISHNQFRNLKPLFESLVNKKNFSINLSSCNLPLTQQNVIQNFLRDYPNVISQLNLQDNKFTIQFKVKEIDQTQKQMIESVNTSHNIQQPPHPESPVQQRKPSANQQNMITSTISNQDQQQYQQNNNNQSTFINYQTLQIQEITNDVSLLIQSIKLENRQIGIQDLEILQQIVQSIIQQIDNYNEKIINTYKNNFFKYQELQKIMGEAKYQLQELFNNEIFSIQNKNLELINKLDNQLVQYQENILQQQKEDTLQHNNHQQTVIKQLETEIEQLQEEANKHQMENLDIEHKTNQLQKQIEQNKEYKTVINKIIEINQNNHHANNSNWKCQFANTLKDKIVKLLEQIKEQKSQLGELISQYENMQ